MKQKNIHWFPGHMVKAMRQIEERLKVIDIIIEIVDSRAPISSIYPVPSTSNQTCTFPQPAGYICAIGM